jgi:4-amino-4-deoxy-L-arabinose transferase-like glycosyltransferase
MTFSLILALTLLIPFILGLAILKALLGKRLVLNFWEMLALAFSVGWGGHIIIMFLMSLAKIPLNFITTSATDLFLAFGLFCFSFRSFFPSKIDTSFEKGNWGVRAVIFIFFCVIAFKVLFVFFFSFIKPVIDPDIIRCYALGAKSIFLNRTFLGAPAAGDKPPFPFLSLAWPALATSRFDDSILTLAYPFLFISFLIIFFRALKRSFSFWYASLGIFFLSSIPLLVFHASTAYSDFPQAFYYCAATIYLFLFFKTFKANKSASFGFLLISALLLGISVWVKKSGLYLAGINILVASFFIFSERKNLSWEDKKNLGLAFLIFLLLCLPWLSYHQFYTLKSYSAEALASLPKLPFLTLGREVMQAIWRNAFFEDNWHLLGILLLATLLLFPELSLAWPYFYLLIIISLSWLMIFILFCFTRLDRFIFDDTLLNRLTLHFVPVILYFSIEVIGTYLKAEKKEELEK